MTEKARTGVTCKTLAERREVSTPALVTVFGASFGIIGLHLTVLLIPVMARIFLAA